MANIVSIIDADQIGGPRYHYSVCVINDRGDVVPGTERVFSADEPDALVDHALQIAAAHNARDYDALECDIFVRCLRGSTAEGKANIARLRTMRVL